jgi:hypothetical protein
VTDVGGSFTLCPRAAEPGRGVVAWRLHQVNQTGRGEIGADQLTRPLADCAAPVTTRGVLARAPSRRLQGPAQPNERTYSERRRCPVSDDLGLAVAGHPGHSMELGGPTELARHVVETVEHEGQGVGGGAQADGISKSCVSRR